VYLVDTLARKVMGNVPNPQAGPTTNADRITSGILVGREPHESTFTRNGRELRVAVRAPILRPALSQDVVSMSLTTSRVS
jgi:hypothetical protein